MIPRPISRSWEWLPFALLLVAVCALWSVWPLLLREWFESSSAYVCGPFLLVLALWLIRRRRQAPQLQSAHRCIAGLILCAALGAVAVRSAREDSVTLTFGAVLLTILTLYGVLLGWSWLRANATSMFLIAFALPIWAPFRDVLLWPLTISVGPKLAAIFGAEFEQVGSFIFLAGGAFHIAQECSGERFFAIFMPVSLLLGDLLQLNAARRARIALVGLLVSVTLNWARVAAIIIVGASTDMAHPIVKDHGWLGHVVFAVGLGLFLTWVHLYSDNSTFLRKHSRAPGLSQP